VAEYGAKYGIGWLPAIEETRSTDPRPRPTIGGVRARTSAMVPSTLVRTILINRSVS
jgi:hypothetical protein